MHFLAERVLIRYMEEKYLSEEYMDIDLRSLSPEDHLVESENYIRYLEYRIDLCTIENHHKRERIIQLQTYINTLKNALEVSKTDEKSLSNYYLAKSSFKHIRTYLSDLKITFETFTKPSSKLPLKTLQSYPGTVKKLKM